jgi:hypothetical protein
MIHDGYANVFGFALKRRRRMAAGESNRSYGNRRELG